MELTVHKLATVFHITERTLRHYDATGILKPTGRSRGGYRIYDDAAVQKLRDILLLKECEFSLEDIKKVVSSSQYSSQAVAAFAQKVFAWKEQYYQQWLQAFRENDADYGKLFNTTPLQLEKNRFLQSLGITTDEIVEEIPSEEAVRPINISVTEKISPVQQTVATVETPQVEQTTVSQAEVKTQQDVFRNAAQSKPSAPVADTSNATATEVARPETETNATEKVKSAGSAKSQNEAILAMFISAESYNSPQALKASELWQKYLTEHFYTCTDELLLKMADQLIAGGNLATVLNKKKEGLAVFMAKSLKYYVAYKKMNG